VALDLNDVGEGGTAIAYKIDLSMVGKLAMFGDRIMRSKTANMEREFVANLRGRMRAEA
jgi:carbon monoxide dehydrogenase subunit G